MNPTFKLQTDELPSGEGFREFNQLRTLETPVMGSKMKEAKPNFR